ncbi:MAG: methylmalonyl Co-A mutase-associated GTPase MeaB [Phycisphaerae bacterium]|nr:methylmalonyl Co-A mutase-associated GTPase MeaB [Phycisphaerae bacterium]
MNTTTVDVILDRLRDGDRRSLARAMSVVDGPGPDAQALKDRLRQSTGRVPWWGFTGPPGVGKSTLIDAVLTVLRKRGHSIGVVAVDPTSPMSDGAMLGDRIRMMRHAVDQDVFIRSLATHHREGGLSDATLHCASLLELAGYDHVLIETVGVGQNEVDIASVADICVVILGPGYGDDIQLTKAGLLEIADIVAVNKCDLPEASCLLNDVREELGQSKRQNAETPKRRNAETSKRRNGESSVGSAARTSSPSRIEIVGIEAKSGKGVDQLLEKLIELDRAARGADRRAEEDRTTQRRHRRVLGEIQRSAMLTCEQALRRGLAAPAARDLIARLERGELTLNAVISRLAAAALAELQGQDGTDERTD